MDDAVELVEGADVPTPTSLVRAEAVLQHAYTQARAVRYKAGTTPMRTLGRAEEDLRRAKQGQPGDRPPSDAEGDDPPPPAGQRDRTADERDSDAGLRDHLSGQRDRAADQRDVLADARDRRSIDITARASERDRESDERDRAAQTRDDAAEARVPDGAARADRSSAAADRAFATSDREAAARDRLTFQECIDLGAQSRQQASDDRVDASVDRLVAGVDRDDARDDRMAGLLDEIASRAGKAAEDGAHSGARGVPPAPALAESAKARARALASPNLSGLNEAQAQRVVKRACALRDAALPLVGTAHDTGAAIEEALLNAGSHLEQPLEIKARDLARDLLNASSGRETVEVLASAAICA